MKGSKEKLQIIIAGLLIGVVAAVLVLLGNPANMGFCIACFIRDTAGALGLHRAAAVQYLRPEIIGIILGSFLLALGKKEFSPRGGSSPMTRLLLGFFAMIGCLMFLGCPFRMILRMAGGDLNALLGLLGFAAGIGCGVIYLKRGYSLKRTYKLPASEGGTLPAVALFLLILLILALLRRKKKKDEPEEDRKERGRANEISYQNGSDTADASAAVSPRDGTPH